MFMQRSVKIAKVFEANIIFHVLYCIFTVSEEFKTDFVVSNKKCNPYHGSGSYSPAFHHTGQGSVPG
jgi:hypothetical protein